MFIACGIWCLADVSSVSPSSEQTGEPDFSNIFFLVVIVAVVVGSTEHNVIAVS